MAADLSALSKKLNLYSDESYEDFRDVLTDNAVDDQYTPLEAGEVKWFGNGCRLEGVSNTPVDVNRDQEFLSDVIGPSGGKLESLVYTTANCFCTCRQKRTLKLTSFGN